MAVAVGVLTQADAECMERAAKIARWALME
jgi:hypothetical protein